MLSDDIPPFDAPVPFSGYRWWYIDGVSDCRRYGLVVIAFIGSVFSPYYYRARRNEPADPRNFCAINVASYGPRARAWAMTERGKRQLQTSPDTLQIGRSNIGVSGQHINLQIDERTSPWLRRLAGSICVTADHSSKQIFDLDAGGRHVWQPIAPIARIKVALAHPEISWQGDAYVDTNFGVRPLEDDFTSWNWSSVRRPHGSEIYYAALERNQGQRHIALSINERSEITPISSPPATTLKNSRWGVMRESQHGAAGKVIETLEDTPFYARSLLAMDSTAESDVAMHESLSLDRFKRGWVRTLLPFRMPRITR